MLRWYFAPILDSYAIIIVLAMSMIVLLCLGPRYGKLSKRQKAVLLSLRIVLIAIVVVAMLRPNLIRTKTEQQSGTLLIAYDQSRSLEVADIKPAKSRWSAILESLREISEPLSELGSEFEIGAYSFDEVLHPREVESGVIKTPQRPTGKQTDIGFALNEIIRREIGKRVIGVLLLSDGAQRTHVPRYDLQMAGREMARLGIPLYTVAYGRPRDQSQARDVSVQNMQDQYSVFVRNELIVQGTVTIQGYVNQDVKVQLKVESPDGETQVVGTKQLVASEANQQLNFEFNFTPNEPGQHKLTVVADEQPGELITANNSLDSYLNVLDGGISVLFINGNLLGHEQQVIRWSLGSSPDIQLHQRTIDMRLQDKWPIDLSSALREKYDVYLISDVNARAIGEENARLIAKAVEDGAGLMMTGGYYSFGPGEYLGTPIGNLLPIEIARFSQQEIGPNAAIRSDLHLDGKLQMLPTGRHFITRLTSIEKNDETWQELKPLIGANKIRAKSRAAVLANTASGDNLLVAWPYADGRVIAFAGDSTHRWWNYGKRAEHKRFWRQAMLWLAGIDETRNQEVWVTLQQRRFSPGTPIRFRTGMQLDQEPVPAGMKAELVFPNGQREQIRLSSDEENWSGYFDEMLEPGEYRIEVSGKYDTFTGNAIGRFVVLSQDLELADPAANPEQMKLLASLTADVGGKFVLPEQLSELIEEIKNAPAATEIEVESKWQLGDTATDSWAVFLVSAMLLSIEWYLRKRWGLV